MRFGNWRGVTLAIALVSMTFVGGAARADWFSHAIPKETPAMDYRTGGPYYAPPIPYGHYAKDSLFGTGKLVGGLKGHLAGLGSGLHGAGSGLLACKNCGGNGCGACGGRGFFGHGQNDGDCGHGHGLGLGAGLGCGSSCQFGKKHFGKLHGGSGGCDTCGTPIASAQAPIAAPQAPVASAQSAPCGLKGCGAKIHHHHGSNAGCGLCGGNGLGIGHGNGHGLGLGSKLCGLCGGRGCGACAGHGNGNGGGCGLCGGRGCGACLGGLGGLGAKAHGALYGLLHPHAGKIKYFVGPGGPVPITPGYVDYVVPTRSPRDFLAFPPFTP